MRHLLLAVLFLLPAVAHGDIVYDLDGGTPLFGSVFILGQEITLTAGDAIDEIIIDGLSDSVSGTVTMTVFVYDGDGDGTSEPGALLGSVAIVIDLSTTATSLTFDFGGLVIPADGEVVIGLSGTDVFTYDGTGAPSPGIGTFVAGWTSFDGGSSWGASVPVFAVEVVSVPEPSTLSLIGLILLGLGLRRRAAA